MGRERTPESVLDFYNLKIKQVSVGLTGEITHQAQVLVLKTSVRRNSSVLDMHGRRVLQCPVNHHPATAMSSCLPAFSQCLTKNLLKPQKSQLLIFYLADNTGFV